MEPWSSSSCKPASGAGALAARQHRPRRRARGGCAKSNGVHARTQCVVQGGSRCGHDAGEAHWRRHRQASPGDVLGRVRRVFSRPRRASLGGGVEPTVDPARLSIPKTCSGASGGNKRQMTNRRGGLCMPTAPPAVHASQPRRWAGRLRRALPALFVDGTMQTVAQHDRRCCAWRSAPGVARSLPGEEARDGLNGEC